MKIEQYIEYLRYEKGYSSLSEISYLNDLTQFRDYLLQNYGMDEDAQIEEKMIREWIAKLMRAEMKPSTVNRKLSSLKSYFNFLLKKQIIEKNPAQLLKGPKKNKQLPQFVRDRILEDIIDTQEEDDFESIRNKLILELFYITGIRRAELIGLTDSDIDIDNRLLKVLGKRNKERLVPLLDESIDLIARYREVRDREVSIRSDKFFVRKSGDPVYPGLIYRIVKKILMDDLTLSKKSPHVLRHSFATEMLNNGAEINAVKEILGHSSLASTEVYTHLSFEELKKAYQQSHPRSNN